MSQDYFELQTPFWHSAFIKIVVANLLVSTSVYMFLPFFPEVVAGEGRVNGAVHGWAAALYCAGICLPAPFCNYWLDSYRRKRVVQWALFALMLVTSLMFVHLPLWVMLLLRLLQGGAFGVFQIALGSTLLLDLSNTRQRTEVAHVYYWLMRLALAFGPLLFLIVPYQDGNRLFMALSLFLPLVAWVLVSTLFVPFRAPLNPVLLSLDRFWLPRGFRIFVSLFLTSFYIGLCMAEFRQAEFYLLLVTGYLLALSLHQMVLKDNIQREIILGFLLFVLVGIFRFFRYEFSDVIPFVGVLLGMGTGFVTSRFLLSYIRICSHCERGTAQTSYWIGWEAGLTIGFSMSYIWGGAEDATDSFVSMFLIVSAFAFYLLAVRKWYMLHRRK